MKIALFDIVKRKCDNFVFESLLFIIKTKKNC